MPRRIQLHRTKGWRMPANAVKIDRSTRWGNPWPIGKPGPHGEVMATAEQAQARFRRMLHSAKEREAVGYPSDPTPLRGKDVACWCTADAPCHGDVLLEWVNRSGA